MANRTLSQFQYSFEKELVKVLGSVSIGSSGAVSSYQGGGVASVSKVSGQTGQYDIVLQDKYNRILGAEFVWVDDALVNVASVQVFQAPATLQSDFQSSKTIRIAAIDFAGAAVEPASGATLLFKLVMRNSSYGPHD